jgi:RNA polymerase sigma factor (sigma-70 family)
MSRITNDQLKQWLPRCVAHDEDAWSALFQGLYGLLKDIALRSGLRDESVDEAVQEAFLKIVQCVREVAEARNPLAYIGALARYTALNMREQQRRRGAHEGPMPEENEDRGFIASAGADQPRQGHGIMVQQLNREIARLAKGLKPEERRLLHLKYVDDFTYDEIAYIYGKESGALRVAAHRLVKALGARLDPAMREMAAAEPALWSRVLGAGLDDYRPEAVDPALQQPLEDYVVAPEDMSAAARARVEAALATSGAVREAKVRLERALPLELDVRGHADPEPMPAAMLERLMGAVRHMRDAQRMEGEA